LQESDFLIPYFLFLISYSCKMKSFRFFLPAFIWLIISTILLTLPGTAFPQENWMDRIWMDKWIHVGMFAIMATLISWAFFKKGIPLNKHKNYFITAGLIALGYGIIMEFVQLFFVAHRSFDWIDIVSDAAGSFIGVWFSIRRYIKK
jgi:VanZ family protein